jgi:small ligand-binding sensory domain FIST
MDFRYAHANEKDWRTATSSCIAQLGRGPASLGFLYVTDHFAGSLGDMLAEFRGKTGVAHWIGTVGIGVCANGKEYLDEPAIAVMLGDFEPDTFHVFSGVASAADVDNVALKCGSAAPNFAIVHADPYNKHVAELVNKLAGRVESGFLVGGLTSSRKQNLQVADGLVEGGLSGVSFADSVTVATRLTQGCSPIGPKHEVTQAQQNVIIMLDGRPALDVFREDIGEALGRDLNRVGGVIFAGLPIKGSDTGDYLVRNLVGIDPANKLIAIGELVQTGATVMFCRRDTKTANEDMTRMLDSIRKGMYSKPRGGIYYSCLGRGASLFGPNSEELKMIREALGDFPLVGFFCNGEISHNRLYGYTGVLTLFV